MSTKPATKPWVITDLFYGSPDWEMASRELKMCLQPLDRPYLHLTLGARLHTLQVGEQITVALDDGHWWDLKVRETGQTFDSNIRSHQRVKVDLEHRHSLRCPCHSTNARGSLEFAIQAERAKKHLHK